MRNNDVFFQENINTEHYFVVKYYLESSVNLKDAALQIAIGQSIGNPNVDSGEWETKELIKKHSCIILDNFEKLNCKSGYISIAFPLANLSISDGISQLLCQIMGGQLDINSILQCHICDISFPAEFKKRFSGPRYGIDGIRSYTNCYNKPLLGGIIKPKIGLSPNGLLDIVKQMVEGGVNLIKEDEIMSNPNCCTLYQRVPLIMDYLRGKNVIYAVCINSDSQESINRVLEVEHLGANAVHINFWSGLGCYNAIRKMDLPLFLFFQKSGDKILTNEKHAFHIKWEVICKLAGLMGVDFVHAGGPVGGYSDENEESVNILRHYNVMPSISCGMHPGLVKATTEKFGTDYMANVGGAIHGHPGGTLSGAKAMRQAIDGKHGEEYKQAVDKWSEK